MNQRTAKGTMGQTQNLHGKNQKKWPKARSFRFPDGCRERACNFLGMYGLNRTVRGDRRTEG
jgi:hypothetical protein